MKYRARVAVHNPAGDAEANARYEAMIASGEWLGPEAVHAGNLLNPAAELLDMAAPAN